MSDFYTEISDKITAFIKEQSIFFVATAAESSRINLSPKGTDSFRVFGPNLVGYMDFTGSGNETSAHIKHDGRVTVMLTSFTRNPLILRLYGQGRVARPGSAEFEEYIGAFPEGKGVRQIIFIDVETVQTSCGYGVPEMDLVKERPTMRRWAEKKGADAILEYQQTKNAVSIDGLDSGLND